jgi:hypothetical protein
VPLCWAPLRSLRGLLNRATGTVNILVCRSPFVILELHYFLLRFENECYAIRYVRIALGCEFKGINEIFISYKNKVMGSKCEILV